MLYNLQRSGNRVNRVLYNSHKLNTNNFDRCVISPHTSIGMKILIMASYWLTDYEAKHHNFILLNKKNSFVLKDLFLFLIMRIVFRLKYSHLTMTTFGLEGLRQRKSFQKLFVPSSILPILNLSFTSMLISYIDFLECLISYNTPHFVSWLAWDTLSISLIWIPSSLWSILINNA